MHEVNATLIEIIPATPRDYTFIAAEMREEDKQEVYCQLPQDATSQDVALLSYLGKHTYTALLSGKPVAAFGATEASLSGTVYSAWAWGTKKLPRVAPRIGRYFTSIIAPKLVIDGVRRLEIRSIESHHTAHKWLSDLGARCECRLEDYGSAGETFLLYSFTLTDLRKSRWQPTPVLPKKVA